MDEGKETLRNAVIKKGKKNLIKPTNQWNAMIMQREMNAQLAFWRRMRTALIPCYQR